ncbi:MAG: carboxypeptidase-like regulatory domain-containing protein [candidate division NC10 bacterium]|nr:carboxypeptidase-like regulatory domain-containing protein [candidate division NC10 bacterium]
MRQLALIVGMLVVLAGCATARVAERRVITGRVTDAEARPVAGTPVLLVGRDLGLALFQLGYEELGRREARVLTDERGEYRLEVVPGHLGNNLYLFFYDRDGFDHVRYARPEPVDFTKRLKEEPQIVVNQVLRSHPDWPEVVRLRQEYGPDSHRGRILRQMGLPERREATQSGGDLVEQWHYFSRGVTYVLRNGELSGTHQFEPIKEFAKPRS